MLGLQRWKAGSLLASWIAYWAGLVGISVGSGLWKAWQLTRQPGVRGTISASLDDGRLLLSVHPASDAAGAWTFNTSVATALAWIAVPPLALWILWLMSRPRRSAQPQEEVSMLDAPEPTAPVSRHQEGTPVRR